MLAQARMTVGSFEQRLPPPSPPQNSPKHITLVARRAHQAIDLLSKSGTASYAPCNNHAPTFNHLSPEQTIAEDMVHVQEAAAMAQNNDAYKKNHRRDTIHYPHRLSFWQRTDHAHDLYLKGGQRPYASTFPKMDYGDDNFSYDEAHLLKWQLPNHIILLIPQELHEKIEDWSLAGAILCTSLDRIGNLHNRAIAYAYPPDHTKSLPISAVGRFQGRSSLSAVAGAETPPESGAATPSTSHQLHQGGKSLITPLSQKINGQIAGLESPPDSPKDSLAASPTIIPEPYKGVLSDLMHTQSDLSGDTTPFLWDPLTSTNPEFDPLSWGTYLKKYDNELNEARDCLKRLKGYGKSINVDCRELMIFGDDATVAKTDAFSKYWVEFSSSKITEYEMRVAVWVEPPKLAMVEHEHETMRSKLKCEKPNYILDST